eukprot:6129885-Pleurochrysis_carterae.AAC.2
MEKILRIACMHESTHFNQTEQDRACTWPRVCVRAPKAIYVHVRVRARASTPAHVRTRFVRT